MTEAAHATRGDGAEAKPYSERAAQFERLAADIGRASRLVSNFRGLSFGIAVVSLVTATLGGKPSAGPIAAAASVVFVALVIRHSHVIAREDEAIRLARVNADARARVTGAWHSLPDDGARFASDAHPYASDLDLFGKGSVYQRINVAHTRFGQDALARFLLEPADPPTIRRRQEASRALAPLLDQRQRLEALAIAVVEPTPGLADGRPAASRRPVEPPDPEPLLTWAEQEPWLTRRPGLVAALYVLPVLTFGTMFFGGLVGLPAGS